MPVLDDDARDKTLVDILCRILEERMAARKSTIMARPGLMRHRKFIRLARAIGSKALARGYLEIIWEACYDSGDPRLGAAGDVEFLAGWDGEPGALTRALHDAGFLDLIDSEYQVHDLYDHAPDYVRRRMERETERKKKGRTLSDIRAIAGSKGGRARAQKSR